MLRFYSANVRSANSKRAVEECLDIAFEGQLPEDCQLILVNATLGHQLDKIASVLQERLPGATVLGSSCGGVTGRDGVGESMNDIAMMAVCGPAEECHFSAVDGIDGRNAYEKTRELAETLKKKAPGTSAVYLLCPGIDMSSDLALQSFNEVFGEDMPIFGGTSSDNMRGRINQQYIGDTITQQGAWAVGFSDPTLGAITRATHGFTAYGNPMVITKAVGNRILELDGKPAWEQYTARLGIALTPETTCASTIPIGALAEELSPDLAKEYGNSHVLRVVTKFDEEGAIYYPVTAVEGTSVWLTMRDEDLIFSEQQASLDFIKEQLGDKAPVAVFQTDCLARGRLLFNKVIKDEMLAMIQSSLLNKGEVPPWLGMYGFGEYTRLGGKNAYHNYTTALLVLYRQA